MFVFRSYTRLIIRFFCDGHNPRRGSPSHLSRSCNNNTIKCIFSLSHSFLGWTLVIWTLSSKEDSSSTYSSSAYVSMSRRRESRLVITKSLRGTYRNLRLRLKEYNIHTSLSFMILCLCLLLPQPPRQSFFRI